GRTANDARSITAAAVLVCIGTTDRAGGKIHRKPLREHACRDDAYRQGRCVMSKAKWLAVLFVGTALFGTAFVRVTRADGTSSSAALTGTVSSQADGPMEGVLVGAKKTGSTISTWVVSNAQGQFSFPRDRMEPGKYAVSIRAVGYE